jgi:hypothetical protein
MAFSQILPALGNVPKRSANLLCFIVDEDFLFRHDLAKELQRDDIDTVEFFEQLTIGRYDR